MASVDKCRSWFCVWNNPEKVYADLKPEQIAETVLEEWIKDQPTRTGAVAYCISADGLKHLHMVLEDSSQIRFSALKKMFPSAHLQPTMGTKEQAEDYIQKKGKWAEKGEEIVYTARFGEIKGRQGQRKDMEIIADCLEKGMKPDEIIDINFSFRRYSNMIREAYIQKRRNETKWFREVAVYWHVGESGSGKSRVSSKLVEEYGESELYLVSDYKNGFDRYSGERILFLDELREQLRYPVLLGLLDGYKIQVSARYSNVYALWSEVHITSPFSPDEIYKKLVVDDADKDSYQQLKRRINYIIYHWEEDGQLREYQQKMEDYISYRFLEQSAKADENGFVKVPDNQPVFGDI